MISETIETFNNITDDVKIELKSFALKHKNNTMNMIHWAKFYSYYNTVLYKNYIDIYIFILEMKIGSFSKLLIKINEIKAKIDSDIKNINKGELIIIDDVEYHKPIAINIENNWYHNVDNTTSGPCNNALVKKSDIIEHNANGPVLIKNKIYHCDKCNVDLTPECELKKICILKLI